MANIRIYNRNAISTATLSGGSWLAGLPLENLREQRPKLKARSTNTVTTSTQFRVELTAPLTVLGIQLVSTNLSSAAQYKITWYTDATFTTAVDTTDWQSVGVTIDWSMTDDWLDWLDPDFWLGATPFVDPDNQGRDIRYTFAVETSVQYLKVEIDDGSNPDGFVEIGYGYFGRAFVPSTNIDFGASFGRDSLTSIQETVGGSKFFNRRGSRKRLTIAWSALPSAEVLGEIDDISQIHDIDLPVYVDLDPDNLTTGVKTAFLATITKIPDYQLVAVFFGDDNGVSTGFEFQQVI